MTVLAEPAVLLTAAPHPTAPTEPAVHPVPRAATAPAVRGRLADIAAITERLLRQRDALPAHHPDRVRLRARIIEENLPMATRLARRYAGRGELLDDLTQVAALALVKAVDGFDADRETPFAGYAIPSILGGLKRHFRDSSWGVRVPRSTQELAGKLSNAGGELSQRWGRTPTSGELADHLRVNIEDLHAAVAARHAYRPGSLNVPGGTTDSANLVDLIDLLGAIDPRYAGVDDHLSLVPLLATLPPRERRILAMRFFDEMTQTSIAAEIGVSQMQVSRLLSRSLAQLRAASPA